MDAYAEGLKKKEQKFGNSGTLAQEIQSGFVYKRGLLPTPTAMDSSGATANMKSTQVKEGSMHSVTLSRALSMGLLPTPVKSDYTPRRPSENWKGGDLSSFINMEITGKTSQLNPRFVLEMMGFPPDWTELPFQSGATNQSKQPEMP